MNKNRIVAIPYWNSKAIPHAHMILELGQDEDLNGYFCDCGEYEIKTLIHIGSMDLVIRYDGASYIIQLNDTDLEKDHLIVATHTYKEAVEVLEKFSAIASRMRE